MDVTQNAPSAMLEVSAIKFIDVRKKELMYVLFKLGAKEYVINVGKQTFQEVQSLVNQATSLESKQKEDALKQTKELLNIKK